MQNSVSLHMRFPWCKKCTKIQGAYSVSRPDPWLSVAGFWRGHINKRRGKRGSGCVPLNQKIPPNFGQHYSLCRRK